MESVVVIWGESFSGREIHGIKNNEYDLKNMHIGRKYYEYSIPNLAVLL